MRIVYKFGPNPFALFLMAILLLFQCACRPQNEQPVNNEISKAPESVQTIPSINQTDILNGDLKTGLPVSIAKVTKGYGKPPLQGYGFDIEFKGRRDGYRWLIMPLYLDSPLKENGIFKDEFRLGDDLTIGGRKYSARQNRDTAVFFDILAVENSFRAIRPPAEGTIKFSSFGLWSDSDVSELEIWEVRALLVNGETPLEEWLPYDTASTSTKRPFDSRRDDWESLSLDSNVNNAPKIDYPKVPAKFIVAKGIRKWKIPFKIVPED